MIRSQDEAGVGRRHRADGVSCGGLSDRVEDLFERGRVLATYRVCRACAIGVRPADTSSVAHLERQSR